MKYRTDYELTHDIDFFFKYNGKYYHAASNGQRLPKVIDSSNNRLLQMKIEQLPATYDVVWSPASERLSKEYDFTSFEFFAERGFISLDCLFEENESASYLLYIVVARTAEEPDFSLYDEVIINNIPTIDINDEYIFINDF